MVLLGYEAFRVDHPAEEGDPFAFQLSNLEAGSPFSVFAISLRSC